MPRVSVIIPTYNRAHLVGRSIQSVLDQTYQDFELIVVDDGSTDNTETIIKSFNDPHIRYIRHEQNRGAAAAKNTGIKAAHGEYIAFQGSDDEYLPEKLEKQMRLFEQASPRVGVVYTGFHLLKGDQRIYMPSSYFKIKDGDIHNELMLRGNFVADGTAIIRKGCFERVGMYDEYLPRFQDWDIFIRISKHYIFRYIAEPMLVASFTPDSISANHSALIRAFKLIMDKHFRALKPNKKMFANVHYLCGNSLCQAGCMHEGRAYLMQAVCLRPQNANYFMATLASLFGKGAYANVVNLKRTVCSLGQREGDRE